MEQQLQPWATIITYYVVGLCLGIGLHFFFQVWATGGRTIGAVFVYVKANNLALFMSVFSYTAIVFLWVTEGLEFMGMQKGILTGAVILAAYTADSLFKNAADVRLRMKSSGDRPTIPPGSDPPTGAGT